MRIALRLTPGCAGALSGKKSRTASSRCSLPSAMASPTAVDVKLLLSEKSMCGSFAAYGCHQPSAITRPWRTIITLCKASIVCSAWPTNS